MFGFGKKKKAVVSSSDQLHGAMNEVSGLLSVFNSTIEGLEKQAQVLKGVVEECDQVIAHHTVVSDQAVKEMNRVYNVAQKIKDIVGGNQ